MVAIFWLLFLMYIGLASLYTLTQTEPVDIQPWPILPTVPKELERTETACQATADCPPNHVCLGGTCIPQLLRGHECDPATGEWMSYERGGATFAICVCLNNQLITQKYFGANCDVNVGCGVHGHYIPERNACKCDPGYKAVGLTCQKVPVLEGECDSDEPLDGFHPDYPTKCVKRPCSFDALSGRPLKQARYDPDWGCVCDPRYGLFGVLLDGTNKKYLNSEGFDACASIFLKEPQSKLDVKLVTYFYLGKREPVSLIVFDNLKEEDLAPLFRGYGGQFMIGQSLWRFDYAQHYFKNNRYFRARTRHIEVTTIYRMEIVNEFKYIDYFKPTTCEAIPRFSEGRRNQRVDAYDVLYKSPVCLELDPTSIFYDRFIVNPQQLTFSKFPHFVRFNAFVLHFDARVGYERWTLDLDYPFNVDNYIAIETNVPVYPVP